MRSTRLVTGGLLVIVPLVFTLGFTGLQASFDYPAILRQPAGEVLARFAVAGPELRFYWYAMFAAALALIPAAIGFAVLTWRTNDFAAALAGGFGVLAGLVQALGLLRWVILVPQLATAYVAPGATDLDHALAASTFDAANAYLGMGVGEHLGYLFTALFTISVARVIAPRWPIMAWAGVVAAIGVVVGMGEPFGVPMAATINAIAFTAWSLWALVLGGLLLWRREAFASPA